MPSRHLARTIGFGLITAAAVGCSEPTAPSDFAGTFVIAESRLPVHLFTNEFGAVFAIADTIRFSVDGQGSVAGTEYVVPTNPGTRSDTTTSRGPFSFRVVNGKAEVTFPCPPNANCLPGPHMIATRTAEGLHITYPNSIALPQDYVELRGAP